MALLTTREGQLLKDLVTARGGTQPIIDSYNFVIRHRFRRIMESLSIKTSDGNVIVIGNPVFVRPSVPDMKGQYRPLLPAEARRNGQTLDAQMFGTIQIRTPQGVPLPDQRREVFLGKVPVMILSELDHNAPLTKEERYNNGEPEEDQGGYFIIGGMEKFMNSPEHLRTLYPFGYEDKNGVNVRYTSQTITDSTVNIVLENNNIVETTFTKIGITKHTLNIFYIFYVLGVTNTVDEALILMYMFINGPNALARKKKLRYYLEATISAFNAQTGGGSQNLIFSHLAEAFGPGKTTNIVNPGQTGPRDFEIVESIRQEYLKNITYNKYVADQKAVLLSKARTLAYMVVKYVFHKIGLRPLDDRDSWGNKRIDTPGLNFETKFLEIWKKILVNLQTQVNTKSWKTADEIRNGIDRDLMGKEFKSAFTKGTWGRRDVPIVEMIKRDNNLAVVVQVRRVTTPTTRRAKIRDKRMVHTSQFNVMCPEATPEGEACGLVKDPAISIYMSQERDIQPILGRLHGAYSPIPDLEKGITTSLFLNGIHLGFCPGDRVYGYLLALRRSQQIYFDTAIIYNSYDELWIYTTSGRVVIPYLVVDPDSQELVIDQKNLWQASIEDLLTHGALEYIDNAEQEQDKILIAKVHSDLKEFRDDLAFAREGLRKAEEDFQRGIGSESQLMGARTALANITKLMKFTHCIIDPSSILGVSASTMPYPEHNPSARITYQCLDITSQVLMGDGSSKEIQYITPGDHVISFDPVSLDRVKTRVIHQFVKPTDKPIVQIQAVSGKVIVATNDHLFLTKEGWTSSLDMIPGETLVCTDSGLDLLESITPVSNRLIADITVESENHSFIANGFCVHNSSMAKQALGPNSSRVELRFDTNSRLMSMPDVPVVATDMHEQMNLAKYPAGSTAIVAIIARGQNQEDAISMNIASVQRGMFMMTIYHSYKTVIKHVKDTLRTVQMPINIPESQKSRYDKLDPATGIVKVGSYVRPDDCLIGIIITNSETKESRNGSLFVEINKEGIVEEVFETRNAEHVRMIEIRIRETRSPEPGDKFASRYSQKGVLGEFVQFIDMPFIMSSNPALNGVVPDIAFNPHGMPSRMTIGLLIEFLSSKLALMKGERVNATAFRKVNIRNIKDALEEIGFSRSGMERMVDGATGRILDAEIYVGAVYYQLLRHLVKYKMQARGTGPIQYLTRQPVSGIRRVGGLRFGEMERDQTLASGSQALVQERFMKSSDVFRPVICSRCGLLATTNIYRASFQCELCKHNVQPVRLEVPYPYQLLQRYLAACNIKLRAHVMANV